MPTAVPGLRDQQRAASEAAILEAAWTSVARFGPDGTSLRRIGSDAGCTHTLVTRYFGSKEGVVSAVGDMVAQRVASLTERTPPSAPGAFQELLARAREDRPCLQLLVRCALADMNPSGFPACLRIGELHAARTARTGGHRGAGRRARLCGYAAASLLLGWVTFEDFLVAATRLDPLSTAQRDSAVAEGAERLLDLGATESPSLHRRDLSSIKAPVSDPRHIPDGSAGELLRAAVEAFADLGPASVSVREVARRAGVNQGLIYRHFGSKDALLAAAIEYGSADLVLAANAAGGFDFDAMSQWMHHGSPAPRIIARALVDGEDITAIRTDFPVLRRLLEASDASTGVGPGDLSDPRLAVACAAGMALGSVIWGQYLRDEIGLSDADGIESALADLARTMVAWPSTAAPKGAPDR